MGSVSLEMPQLSKRCCTEHLVIRTFWDDSVFQDDDMRWCGKNGRKCWAGDWGLMGLRMGAIWGCKVDLPNPTEHPSPAR